MPLVAVPLSPKSTVTAVAAAADKVAVTVAVPPASARLALLTAKLTVGRPPPPTVKRPSTGSSPLVTAGFAGVLQATRINEIEPSFATLSGFELEAIAGVVVGGVSLSGGRGAILGMVLGAALIETVDNVLVLIGAPETIFKGLLGALVIVAVILNTLVRRWA